MPDHINLPASTCPHCGYELDAASNADGTDQQPEPGAISLCIKCQEILEFDEDLQLIAATEETLDSIDDETMATINDIRAMLRAPSPTIH